MISTIVSFVLVLGILIFFHELGHYLVARRSGIVVEEFGMGYPPRAVKLFTFQGTLFTLNWIPFGGFARMKGEDAADMSPGAFNAAPALGRALTLVAGPAMNFILAILFFAFSFMAGFPAPAATPQLNQIPDTSLAAQVGLQPGDILLAQGDRPVMVSMLDEVAAKVTNAEEPGADLTVLRQGATLILTTPADATTADLLAGVEVGTVLNTRVFAISENSPAQTAGLQTGDRVYAINGEIVTADMSLSREISSHADQEMTMTLLRDGTLIDATMIPRSDPPPGEGAIGIGIESASSLATLSLFPALKEGLFFTWEYITFMVRLPFDALSGALAPGQADLVGPIGIAQMVGDAVDATVQTGLWYPIWRLSAILSAALAITNLLPIPALDGGRLIFILVEVLRGKRVSPEREGMVHMIGFVVLLGLMVLITFRDIGATREGLDWIQLLGQ
ncbi:MAG: RIP metalloprotease RseP [Caldilineaceae bacterium]|nr:RIP metalloprotease RseP [Caldilineaceae bacterium]MBP8108396.1 RIP metalloprotease RseP [Caldilineaceae bacterium]MBP8125034.1 RIP metalloprotease RseP [Caldilineaceae bacterium]MBP9072459.1 RIP metalloprotease RseP [Caldilineaceae bacterium]